MCIRADERADSNDVLILLLMDDALDAIDKKTLVINKISLNPSFNG